MIALLFFVAAVSQERPLAYYLTDPCMRRIAAERFGDCTEPRKTKATVRTVGIVADYQIYEVDHVIDESYEVDHVIDESETIAARSLVAGKSKVRLHEFHRQEGRGGAFLPTEISRDANDRQYVTTGHQDVGTLMPMVRGHYYLNGNRLLPLDLSKVSEIAEKAVPKGYFSYYPTAGINADATVFGVAIQLDGKGIGKKSGCCEGAIALPFYIDLSRPDVVRAVPAGPARVYLDDESPGLWTRRVSTGKGEYADAVGPHPLRYFYPHPCLRKDPRERSLTGDFSCSASHRSRRRPERPNCAGGQVARCPLRNLVARQHLQHRRRLADEDRHGWRHPANPANQFLRRRHVPHQPPEFLLDRRVGTAKSGLFRRHPSRAKRRAPD